MSQVHIHGESDAIHLMLSGALTIAQATETRDQLLNELQQTMCMPEQAKRVCLDASQVAEIDSAGVQLLVSTAKWLSARGQTTSLLACADLVWSVATAVGAVTTNACCGWQQETAPEGAA